MSLVPLSKRVILERTEHAFENQAVLNPAVYQEGDITHLWYRAVHHGNFSSIGYAKFRGDELVHRSPHPIVRPQFAYEQHGLEDPRVVCIDGTFYLFYTVYDGCDVQVAYATSEELPHFRKHRVISPHITLRELHRWCSDLGQKEHLSFFCQTHFPPDGPDDNTLLMEKDVFLFPRRIHGRLALIHRIKPDIQLIYCRNLSELSKSKWIRHLNLLEGAIVLNQKYDFESAYIGGGAPPIETSAGWLMIYHAVEENGSKRTYRAGAALLDIDHPEIATHRLPYPLFSPEESWEKVGDVGNVVFPTGALVRDGILDIYYGAADTRIGKISFELNHLLNELLKHPVSRN